MGASCCGHPSTKEPAVAAHVHVGDEDSQVDAHEPHARHDHGHTINAHDHGHTINASEDQMSDTHGHSHSHDEGAEVESLATGTTCCGTEERCDGDYHVDSQRCR